MRRRLYFRIYVWMRAKPLQVSALGESRTISLGNSR